MRYLAKAAAGVLLVLAGFEITVRLFALSTDRRFVVDPVLGRVVAAGSVVRWGSEGWGTTHFTANGEIATPHSGGPNVVVLGDSHTEAFQVDDDRKFVSLAERQLWQRGRRLDLRNFGRSGGSMADFVWLTRRLRERLRPAAFVIQLEEYDFDHRAFDSSRPNFFAWRPGGRIELDHAAVLAGSKPPGIAMLGYAEHRLQQIFSKPAGAPVHGGAGGSVTLQAELLREAAGSVPVILLLLPYSPYASNSETFATLRHVLPWPYVDPSTEFLASRERGRDPRTFFNEVPAGAHLNRDGHAIVAALLAAEIERVLR